MTTEGAVGTEGVEERTAFEIVVGATNAARLHAVLCQWKPSFGILIFLQTARLSRRTFTS